MFKYNKHKLLFILYEFSFNRVYTQTFAKKMILIKSFRQLYNSSNKK